MGRGKSINIGERRLGSSVVFGKRVREKGKIGVKIRGFGKGFYLEER